MVYFSTLMIVFWIGYFGSQYQHNLKQSYDAGYRYGYDAGYQKGTDETNTNHAWAYVSEDVDQLFRNP